MKRTQFFLRKSQIEQLKAMSKRTGAPMAELVRRAIDQYMRPEPTEKRDDAQKEKE